MKYLTVGTDEIREDLLKRVEDTDLRSSMKPRGGLWLTEFDENLVNFNRWVDFMMLRPNILFHKNRGSNPFIQPCSIVTLNDDTNLYVLHNRESLDYLMKCFPYDGKFSYEDLSHYYDGIYVDLGGLYHSDYDKNVLSKFSSFDVNSLILFDLGCIDYYQSGSVVIEPFDPDDSYSHDRYYEINYNKEKKKVLKR